MQAAISASADQLAEIGRVARSVRGVRDAVAVTDRRLRSGVTRDEEPKVTASTGTPMPGDRPALVVGPEPGPPLDAATTLTEALLAAASLAGERGTTYLLGDDDTDRQTYRQLLTEALQVAGGLAETGLVPGDSVLLQCGESRAFVTAFWACVLGGYVPTPVGLPAEYSGSNAAVRKLHAAWELLDHPLVISDPRRRDRVIDAGQRWDGGSNLRVASTADLATATPVEPYPADPDHPVVNLLTSGSTGTPKCVHHVHRSIVARTHAAIAANHFTESDISLNWMSLDHVGGMVMFNVRDVFLQCEHVNALTEAMIRRPLSWLDWIDRFGATCTWAPNFAFALVNKHRDEIERGSWDLSSMVNICNAGEAVVARTALRFVELLEPHGLPADAMVPCWGMSETSSGVTYSRMDARDRSVGTIAVDSASLDGQLVMTDHDAPGSVTMTEVGSPVAGVELRIVDDDGSLLPEGRVGHLHARGTTIMRGYRRNEAANSASFVGDGWFDTGDLGFVRDGRLTLTGRQKHMVIVNGSNYPAHEVEAVVEQVPGVRPACAAVCGMPDEETGTEGVLVFFVPSEDAAGDLRAVVADIQMALTRDIALRPELIVPVSLDEFPRADGGKVQRDRLMERLRAGQFDDRFYDGRQRQVDDTTVGLFEQVWTPTGLVGAGTGRDDNRPIVVYGPQGASWPRRLPGFVGMITPADDLRILAGDHIEIDPFDPGQHDRAVRELIGEPDGPVRFVYGFGTGFDDSSVEEPTRLLVALASLGRMAPEADVTVLTRGATGVRPDEEVVPGRAALTGLVRTAATEGLVSAVHLVDFPADASDDELVRAASLDTPGDDVVAIRDGVEHVARLRVVERSDDLGVPPEFLRAGGTVLVTGGLGGIGPLVVEQLLVSAGARALVVGRRSATELASTDAGESLADLRLLGDVRYTAADVADPGALEAAVAAAEQKWQRPLDLIVHLAGTPVAPQWADLTAHEVGRETVSWMRRMLRPKLAGGHAIEAILGSRPDTAVVLFSSVNGFFGGTGFGAYAAANAAVDGFGQRWAAQGRTVRCLAWTMWGGPGMNDGSPVVPAARRRGLQLLDRSDGAALFLAALHHPASYLFLGADPDNPHIKDLLAPDQFTGGSVVVGVVPEDGADPGAVRREAAEALAEIGVLAQITLLAHLPRDARGEADAVAVLAAREQNLADHVAPKGAVESLVAEVFEASLDVPRVGREDSLFTLGGDSIRLMEAAEGLSERLGFRVELGWLYEYPTVRELAAMISSV